MNYENNLEFAKSADSNDKLKNFRGQFHIPKDKDGNDLIYFCGNSLGLQPAISRSFVEQEMKDWAELAVEAHFDGKNPWKDYHEFLTPKLAQLVGANENEVVAMNSLTVNLNLLLISFYRPTKSKHKIIIESPAFPSDIYSVKSHIAYHGFDPNTSLIWAKARDGESTIRTEDILELINDHKDELALTMLSGVNYYTGQLFDMQKIARATHEANAICGFDLAHTVGNVPLQLHNWDIDFAAWCSYKYLNSGPGATAGIFVNSRFADDFSVPRLAGWWGSNKETRFKMEPEFHSLSGAEGWQNSNPAILPMACLNASLDIFLNAGIENLREKSISLTGYLEYLLNEINDSNIELITPNDPTQRGCQISIRVKNSDKNLFDELRNNGVISDWRYPDVIRVAPVPLYNTFQDVFYFTEKLKNCLRK